MSDIVSGEKVSFLNKPMSLKVFWFFVISSLAIVVFVLSFGFVDSDMYFLIPTGDSILENGIPHENLWTIDKSSGFIAQQWLYAVALSFANRGGPVCVWLFTFAQVLFCLFLMYKLCRIKGLSRPFAYFGTVFSAILSGYFFNVRPQTFTISLLIVECIALEKYIATKKAAWLALLPLTMLFEINGHMSMWFMHYAIVLAYVVPAFYSKNIQNNGIREGFRNLIISVIAMTGIMFVNPYGLDGILYFFKSMTSGVFGIIDIAEMSEPHIISMAGIFVVVILGMIFIFARIKALSSVTLHMMLGLDLMMIFAYRNVMYAPIASMYIFFDINRYIAGSNKHIDWKKDVRKYLYFIFTPVFVFLCSVFFMDIISLSSCDFDTECSSYESLDTVVDYLDEHADKDTRLFTGINNGAYFEYRGYNNIYIDARPELYSKSFCGKDIISDFDTYCRTGVRVEKGILNGMFSSDMHYITNDEMESWLNSCDFEYLIVDYTTPYIMSYLMSSDNYELVVFDDIDSTVDMMYLLFQRKDA